MIKATWEKNDLNPYITKIEDENGKNMTICSSKVESEFLSPRQLVQGALAGCLSMTIRRELKISSVDFEDVIVDVNLEEKNGKTTIQFNIEVVSSADKNIVEEIKKQAIQNCYVRGLLVNSVHVEEKDNIKSSPIKCDCCG